MENVWDLKENYSPVVIRKPSKLNVALESPVQNTFKFKVPMITSLLLLPTTVLASDTAGTFLSIYGAMMGILDYVAVIAIVFAGINWMFGHRTAALEKLICVGIGYLIAIHAVDLRDFLKGL